MTLDQCLQMCVSATTRTQQPAGGACPLAEGRRRNGGKRRCDRSEGSSRVVTRLCAASTRTRAAGALSAKWRWLSRSSHQVSYAQISFPPLRCPPLWCHHALCLMSCVVADTKRALYWCIWAPIFCGVIGVCLELFSFSWETLTGRSKKKKEKESAAAWEGSQEALNMSHQSLPGGEERPEEPEVRPLATVEEEETALSTNDKILLLLKVRRASTFTCAAHAVSESKLRSVLTCATRRV